MQCNVKSLKCILKFPPSPKPHAGIGRFINLPRNGNDGQVDMWARHTRTKTINEFEYKSDDANAPCFS